MQRGRWESTFTIEVSALPSVNEDHPQDRVGRRPDPICLTSTLRLLFEEVVDSLSDED